MVRTLKPGPCHIKPESSLILLYAWAMNTNIFDCNTLTEQRICYHEKEKNIENILLIKSKLMECDDWQCDELTTMLEAIQSGIFKPSTSTYTLYQKSIRKSNTDLIICR